MKTIIVAIDDSPQAQNALVYAASLAKLVNARIILFNSFSLRTKPANLLINQQSMDDLIKEKRKFLEEIASRIKNEYKIQVAYYTKFCIIEEEINDLANQVQADLIVMGIRKDPIKSKGSQSAANAVMRAAEIPVFVVPEDKNFKKPERFLFACDYQTVPCPYTLAVIKLLALQFDAEVQIFNVENKPNSSLKNPSREVIVKEIKRMMKGVKYSFNQVKEKDVASGIEKGLNDFDADILFMSPHKQSFFRSILHKSLTREMTLRGKVPLLALKEN
jgi:nucleotide-binding universal stress UspA family protein